MTIAKGSVLEGTGIVGLFNSVKIGNLSGTSSNTTIFITSSLDVPVIFGFSFADFYKFNGYLKLSSRVIQTLVFVGRGVAFSFA